jgi:transposase
VGSSPAPHLCEEEMMEVLYPRCAGLDIHRDSVVACARVADRGGAEHRIETFGTTTSELERLSRWLAGHGVTHVAMEATGVYWKPVWAVLADAYELVLANAMHVKNVPGRKTDTNDAAWLADLLAHGLVRASFVPPMAIQALRDLTRTRKQLTRERVSHAERIDKLLQAANLKLGSVLSDIMGASGRAILDALAEGETDPECLAARVCTRIRASRAEVVEALRGRMADHQRLLLRIHLGQADAIDAAIAEIDAELGDRLEPFRDAAARLITIPGVSTLSATTIVAEIGTDMSRFPSDAHLVSWAGLCPRSDESAGKRRSTRLRKGAPWLKTLLVQTAWCAVRVKGTYLRALFGRLKARRGPRKAIIAVAAAILTAAYWMLRREVAYADLGADHFDRAGRTRLAARLARKLGELGFDVTLAERGTAYTVSS